MYNTSDFVLIKVATKKEKLTKTKHTIYAKAISVHQILQKFPRFRAYSTITFRTLKVHDLSILKP